MNFFFGKVTFFFLIFFLLPPAFSQLPSSEILSLLAFKKQISHDPSGYLIDSWNEESIDFNGCPSSWNGIVCNADRIAAIVVENRLISGSPDLSALASLTALVRLSLANNNFSSSRLTVSDAGFRSLNFSGPIPESVSSFRDLRSLDLSQNSLSGPIPSALAELDSLAALNLSFNGFSGEIPSALGDISSLVSLDLKPYFEGAAASSSGDLH